MLFFMNTQAIMGGFCTPSSHVASLELVEALAGGLACFSFAMELARIASLRSLIFKTHSTTLVSTT